MGYNSNWQRWVIASVNKYFDSGKNGITFIPQGFDLDNANQQSRVELHINGPKWDERSKDDFVLDFTIRLLVSIIQDDKDAYQIYKITGQFTALCKDIPIYKLGDDASYLGCLILRSDLSQKVVVTHFGQINPDTKMQEATIEADYRILL